MGTNKLVLYYFLLGVLVLIFYVQYKRKEDDKNLEIKKEEFEAGLTEPPSLHPIIDPLKCLGCKACVLACPEKEVLGIINDRAELIAPTRCIGHGACLGACPFDAITLVFGTAKRGVDIPHVKPDFETNVPGVFIAGELGGMGLIRNAVEQGRQAMETIIKHVSGAKNDPDVRDVIVIGAGPAGFSASLLALEQKLNCLTLEQEALGGTVAHYPRGKIVMTQPAHLPMYGKTKFKETTKEELLEFWGDVEKKTQVKINYGVQVKKVERTGDLLKVTCENGAMTTYQARAVLLAVGRRGTPRKLNVPGEEKEKVVYRLIDPHQYQGQHVLVVGGGDSALEAAWSIAEVQGTTVTLSYRSEAISRAKKKNREKVQKMESLGRLKMLLKSNVKEIRDEEVVIDHDGQEVILKNDGIIVCAGGILPTGFLKEIGIEVETKHGMV